jgi:hypothetical protein
MAHSAIVNINGHFGMGRRTLSGGAVALGRLDRPAGDADYGEVTTMAVQRRPAERR